MQRKLTISIDAKVYDGLHAMIGRGHISQFIEGLTRKHLQSINDGYRAMAEDAAREAEAEEWCEATAADAYDPSR